MNSPGQRASRSAVRRWHPLCVPELLVGLLGMHGPAPGGGLPRRSHGQQAQALRYAPAKAMADDIVSAQHAEIGEMNKLLGKSGSPTEG
ncbi:hypothetical protein [Streptomyces sp. NPDC092370]|uniref:hypothetical protein n=1 Tax=Streptomyces sp. NPDC092370 TaxID=3366016 RepID=UPI0037F48B8A